MPLRDHFRAQHSNFASWEGLHGGWPMVIVQHLGPTFPARYVAAPRVHLGSEAEMDIELADADEYEVRVYDTQRGRRLVAAIEIISPANKDRPESRGQFVAKCAALLRGGVSVLMVDVVTASDFNLYAELLELIGEQDPTIGDHPPAIYGVSCRWRPRGLSRWLETWSRPFAIGAPLPVLPLWLSDELAIPLDLEASYQQTCRDLRIH